MKLQRSWLKASKAVDKGMFSSYRQVSNRFDVQGSHINILNKVIVNLQFENIMSCTCLSYPLHCFGYLFKWKCLTSTTKHRFRAPYTLFVEKAYGTEENHAESIWVPRRMSRFSRSTLLYAINSAECFPYKNIYQTSIWRKNPQISDAQMPQQWHERLKFYVIVVSTYLKHVLYTHNICLTRISCGNISSSGCS